MLRTSWGWRIAILAMLVGSACSVVQNEPAANPAAALSETVFRCNVEPILVKQCSYNACHGIVGASFRVYSPGKLRSAVPADIDGAIAPLTDQEHHANYQSAAGFQFGITAVDDNWLLRKPLPSRDGGYEHAGGAIWTGGGDPQYGAIRAWLTNTGACK
jgi:hypothetical protein